MERKTIPISAFIIAQNEVDRIGDAIRSVRDWVDEVIVVDGGSTDDTTRLCESLGAMVVSNPWPGYGKQKRFAEDLCRNTWIFNLDADERVTKPLAEEIHHLFAQGFPDQQGYRVDIVDVYPFEQVPRMFPPKHNQIRLYDKTAGRFHDGIIHDAVEIDSSRVAALRQVMYHYSFRSLSHYIQKIDYFTDYQAADLEKRGRKLNLVRLFFEFPACFFKAYFLKKYFFHGVAGLINSINYAYFRFVRLAKYYELLKKNKRLN